MCGIVGVACQQVGEISESMIQRMCQSIAHRGPDGQGIYIDREAGVGLGHRRLAIIDLSCLATQPMESKDGRYVIVFNGELYNYVEIRGELELKGHVFRSSSDTEVLLEGYQEWGIGVLDKAVGMFAFAIWDRNGQILIMARDRIGKKPLVYFWNNKLLAFASELKALLTIAECEQRLDPDAVDIYLALGYIPAPFTVFKNIKKLQPGHYLQYKNNNIEIKRYWFPENSLVKAGPTAQERLEEFSELFKEAVRIRLRSDVPIAIFLSGGIDSSVVSVECVKLGHRLHAFTVVFDNDKTDLPFAVQTAKHLGLDHEVINISGNELLKDLNLILWHYDEPFADTSSIPSYYIAKVVKGRYKVVLNGDGGDEAFGGYKNYEYIRIKQFIKSIAAMVGIKDGKFWKPWQIYFQTKTLFRVFERQALLDNRQGNWNLERFIEHNPYLGAYLPKESLKRAMWGDRHIYLANDLLYKMDIALMAHGIEGRSPFLDHRLVEWAQSLPLPELVTGNSKKIFLKKIYKKSLPAAVLDRPKYGFGSPIHSWLNGPLKKTMNTYLPTRYFNEESQNKVLKNYHYSGQDHESGRIWTMLIFSIWGERWGVKW